MCIYVLKVLLGTYKRKKLLWAHVLPRLLSELWKAAQEFKWGWCSRGKSKNPLILACTPNSTGEVGCVLYLPPSILATESGKAAFCLRFYWISYFFDGIYIYICDLSQELRKCKTGCMAGGALVNQLMYADECVLFSPNSAGLQKLLNVSFKAYCTLLCTAHL